MSEGDAGDKVFPPTERKLRKRREQGGTPLSADLVGAAASAGAVAAFWSTRHDALAAAAVMFDVAVRAASNRDGFAADLRALVPALEGFAVQAVAPALAAAAAAGVLASIASTRGIPFSVHPLKPNFAKLNPASNLKTVLSPRPLLECTKALFAAASLSGVVLAVLAAGARALLQAPACGLACTALAASESLAALLGWAAALAVAVGMADRALQGGLFLRQERMTHQELKREVKEQAGDVRLKQELLGRFLSHQGRTPRD